MATLYITEYAEMPVGPIGRVGQIGLEPPLAEQTVAIGGAHAESAVFNKLTRVVRLHTDATCSVLIGAAPVATAASGRMVANMTEYRGIIPGSNMLVSVIQNT